MSWICYHLTVERMAQDESFFSMLKMYVMEEKYRPETSELDKGATPAPPIVKAVITTCWDEKPENRKTFHCEYMIPFFGTFLESCQYVHKSKLGFSKICKAVIHITTSYSSHSPHQLQCTSLFYKTLGPQLH